MEIAKKVRLDVNGVTVSVPSASAAHTKVSGHTIVRSTRDDESSEMGPACRIESFRDECLECPYRNHRRD